MQPLSRITLDPAVMGGKACIRGMRVTVGTIVGLLAVGRSREEILKAYPCRLASRGTRGAAGRPMSVQLVIDMNLSPDWVPLLQQHGWSAVHWSTVGDPRASDQTIMAWARANQCVGDRGDCRRGRR